jgi:hypothetical protein
MLQQPDEDGQIVNDNLMIDRLSALFKKWRKGKVWITFQQVAILRIRLRALHDPCSDENRLRFGG